MTRFLINVFSLIGTLPVNILFKLLLSIYYRIFYRPTMLFRRIIVNVYLKKMHAIKFD